MRFVYAAALLFLLSTCDASAVTSTDSSSPQMLAARCEPMDVLVGVSDSARELGVTRKLLRDPIVAMLGAAGVYGPDSSTDQTLIFMVVVDGDRFHVDAELSRTLPDTSYGNGAPFPSCGIGHPSPTTPTSTASLRRRC